MPTPNPPTFREELAEKSDQILNPANGMFVRTIFARHKIRELILSDPKLKAMEECLRDGGIDVHPDMDGNPHEYPRTLAQTLREIAVNIQCERPDRDWADWLNGKADDIDNLLAPFTSPQPAAEASGKGEVG